MTETLPAVYQLDPVGCNITLSSCAESGRKVESNGTIYVADSVQSSSPTNQTLAIDQCVPGIYAQDLQWLWMLLLSLLVVLLVGLLLGVISGVIGWVVYRKRRRYLRESTEIPDLSTVDFSLQSILYVRPTDPETRRTGERECVCIDNLLARTCCS
jgi:hypothetical protein